MKLIAPYPWGEINRRVKQANKEGRRCYAAVPFVSTGARKMLPLKKGSVLVVRLSEASVKAGQTDPSEILKFIKAGVEVHTVTNLHAKVYCLGRYAVVGSANVSGSSTGLIEAVAVAAETAFVAECRDFILGIRGEGVEENFAASLIKHYRAPKGAGGIKVREKERSAGHHPVWVVPVKYSDWSTDVAAHDAKERPKAFKKISTKLDELDSFEESEGPFLSRIQVGDVVLQVIKADRVAWLYHPAHVVHIKRFKASNDQEAGALVYLAIPRKAKARRLVDVAAQLGNMDSTSAN